jgi:hypothetical protein
MFLSAVEGREKETSELSFLPGRAKRLILLPGRGIAQKKTRTAIPFVPFFHRNGYVFFLSSDSEEVSVSLLSADSEEPVLMAALHTPLHLRLNDWKEPEVLQPFLLCGCRL